MSPTASAGRGKPGLLRLRELNPGLSFPRQVLWSFLDTLQVGGCAAATGASNAFCEDPAPRGVGCRHRGQRMDPQGNWVGQLETSKQAAVPTCTSCAQPEVPAAKQHGARQAWTMYRHLPWHGLDHLEGHLGSQFWGVMIQFSLSISPDPYGHYHLQGLILGSPTIFPQGFKVILCSGSSVLVVGQERELQAFGPLLYLLWCWYLLETPRRMYEVNLRLSPRSKCSREAHKEKASRNPH